MTGKPRTTSGLGMLGSAHRWRFSGLPVFLRTYLKLLPSFLLMRRFAVSCTTSRWASDGQSSLPHNHPAENRKTGEAFDSVIYCGNLIPVDLRELIVDELQRRGWSQRELCRRTGMLPHQLCEYLNSTRDIYVATLQRIMEELQLEIRPIGRRRRPERSKPMFVVFEDRDDATETKVHKESCRYYRNRKRNAPTTQWHGPFDTVEAAVSVARSIAEQKSHGVKLRPPCCWKD